MHTASHALEPQPGNETIDGLCFTIQRQSAMCLELVRCAVETEREQCARIAEAEAQPEESAPLAAARIADKIRARRELALAATAAVDAA
jgi:hypothetical protein